VFVRLEIQIFQEVYRALLQLVQSFLDIGNRLQVQVLRRNLIKIVLDCMENRPYRILQFFSAAFVAEGRENDHALG